MKKLYGIGTGPGDKELLTIKAIKTIEKSDLIFAPNNKGKNMAIDTASDYIRDKKLVLIDFPMGRVTRKDYVNAAKIIMDEIPENGIGSFLTIGDPMIYSTFIYILEELEKEDIETSVVSGIPSFVAGAGESKTPLTLKGESFLLCDEVNEDLVKEVDSFALLKTLKDKDRTIEILEKNNFSYKYIKRVSMEGQAIHDKKEDIIQEKDYLSLIIGRRLKEDKTNEE